jgi:hypothetical protein
MDRGQFQLVKAVEAWRRAAGTGGWPAWSDVLAIVRALGYRKTLPSRLAVPPAEDWTEPADAPESQRATRWGRSRT